MVMSTSVYFAQFKQIKAFLAEHPEASDELKKAFADTAAAFKAAYTAEAFKQALTENQPVDSDLEERITSALILFKSERAKASGN
jgi:hypothetical protein